ncbi:MAG: DUF1156 domain-containing protein [Desulfobacteraceae bacterium]|nr:DUF1156 domain-containing protein [Desulfobacteraceae bacterium]
MTYRKKLIEVALPLDAINKAMAREKGNPFIKGHPRNLHQWWARRPQAGARAVIFAQMVDDPSAHPDLFPTEKKQEKERQRLFRIIEDLVKWENSTNEEVLQKARDEIWQSWRYTCAENADHPRAKELFDRYKLPVFHDPFAGGGALPLEAQRLGLESYASDLNPVAVLINKAMIEIPPKFAGRPPLNPDARKDKSLFKKTWRGAQGLAQDVRYYGKWMRDEAEKHIGYLYPKVEVTADMARERSDLERYVGQKLNVIACLWARTVKSPNPAFSDVKVPLVSTFMLSKKKGKEAYVVPIIEDGGYQFTVKVGKPKKPETTKLGTTAGKRKAFRCLMSKVPVTYDYIQQEGKAGRMAARLMTIVAKGDRGPLYLPPNEAIAAVALQVKSVWEPENSLPENPRDFKTPKYGLTTFAHLFTQRQLKTLSTLSDLVQDVRDQVEHDAIVSNFPENTTSGLGLDSGGTGPVAYAETISVFLALSVDKFADYNNSICTWNPTNQNIGHMFTKQSIPMTWDYPEISPLFGGLSLDSIAEGVAKVIELLPVNENGTAVQMDSTSIATQHSPAVFSTDPPYYDNICYADLSDFFYVWLRHSLSPIFPALFSTLAVPKAEELVASPYRHGSKEKAETFFLKGMKQTMQKLAEQAHTAFPITIYYAFKQSEMKNDAGTASTGWEAFLDAVICAGFSITGTWPVRTERRARSIGIGSNALASSIVLVCRKCPPDAPIATRREFIAALKSELPSALTHLQRGNVAPVDLAQAAIGPGMAVYTAFSKVIDAVGKPLSVREALALINQTLDETLAEQEGDFDADSRWALAWFEQSGFDEGEYGVAETLSKAKNTSVAGMVEAGVLVSGQGRVRLLRPEELPENWDPSTDPRLTAWEIVHHLIRTLEAGGEGAAAKLVAKLGSKAENARELCYRLYTLCERKKRAAEALSYNGLVQSWPEIVRMAREEERPPASVEGDLFGAS